MNLEQQIKQQAIELGFDVVGIADASAIGAKYAWIFRDWLAKGYAAEMGYMHNNLEKRIEPQRLLEGAESIIVVGLAYKRVPEPEKKRTCCGRVAGYARYQDYHEFIKERLYKLADFVRAVAGDFEFKVCVDTVPIAERAIAQRAGLGFIGKNHMLINDDFGPQILLGELVTTLKLEPDRPSNKYCGICDKCIRACPTGALRQDGFFDASKCISYLTIEFKGEIGQNIGKIITDSLFGCDRCIDACPRAQKARCVVNNEIKYYPDMVQLDLNEILNMTQKDFDEKFADSPLKRAGLMKLKQTAKTILENLKNDKN